MRDRSPSRQPGYHRPETLSPDAGCPQGYRGVPVRRERIVGIALLEYRTA